MCRFSHLAKVVLILSLLCLIGCGEPGPNKLPRNWPIKQLTLPQGSVLATKVAVLHRMDPTYQKKGWEAYFDCPSNMTSVISEIEACLKPLNYEEFWIENPKKSMDSRESHRNYYSPDGCTQVMIMRGVRGSSAEDHFTLVSDYILSISITKTPHKLNSQVGKTARNGDQTHLEPIE